MARCRKCNRVLKNPVAIIKGIGPVCERKAAADRAANQRDTDDLVEYDGGNFWIERVESQSLNGRTGQLEMAKHTASGIRSNVPRSIHKKSDGYNFGYGGSGPSEFALNICLMLVHADDAYQHFQNFKWKFVAVGDENAERLEIPRADAEQWFRDQGVKLLTDG